MSTTYGNYESKTIRKIFCVRCSQPIPGYNLQRLLDHEEGLCDACLPKEDEESDLHE